MKDDTIIILAFLATIIALVLALSGCSCERQEYGQNNLTITYVNYSNPLEMAVDCDWDAKNLSCKSHALMSNKCILNNCIGNKPTTKRDCK